MSRVLKNIYSLSSCYSILGMMLVGCLLTEGFSHTVQWPSGKYGLPMANSGCPKGDGFSWDTGFIRQDLEVNTTTSSSFHLQAMIMSSGDVRREFCMKTNKSSDTERQYWPYGNYCIYKKGSRCPWGLSEGWVLWDDDNGKTGVNINFQSGSIPNGKYGQDTKIFFCCQTWGSVNNPIELPIDTPFYLIAYSNKLCQEVLNTIHTTEFIRYDTEDDNNHDNQSSPYPYGANLRQPYIYYCYYKACRWTKTALQGSFWSPNYPGRYKDEAWCEWYINVPQNYIISLKFTTFDLETADMCVSLSCKCDYVEVRETLPNGISSRIGKYCMGATYPYGYIKSRGNNMKVIFRSDNTVGKRGFKAQYQAIRVTAPTSLSSTTKDTTARTTITSPSSDNGTSTSFSSSTSVKWTPSRSSSAETLTKDPSPGTSSSSKPTSKATTFSINQNTTTSFATDEQTTTRITEPTKETPTTRITTAHDVSSTEVNGGSEPADNTTVKPGVHEARIENPGTANIYTIAAVTVSLILVAVVVAVSLLYFRRKRNWLKRSGVHRGRLTVSFSAAEKTYGTSNVIPNMYAGSEGNEEKDQCYTEITKLQNVNLLYDNRDFTDSTDQFIEDDEIKVSDNPIYSSSEEKEEKDQCYTNITKLQNMNVLYDNRDFTDSTDQFVDDDEIKESDNPLYSSSVETGQNNNNVLYESMEDLAQCTSDAISDHPVYEGVI